ncbi:hypothetical protein WSM22_17540 [Cytophagales bacterium WSM2-2]|nr:hypothetical protein WSM22_17540 [Cytophagales bacterium WSM2-2]
MFSIFCARHFLRLTVYSCKGTGNSPECGRDDHQIGRKRSILPFCVKQVWSAIKGVRDVIMDWEEEEEPSYSLVGFIELYPLSDDYFILLLLHSNQWFELVFGELTGMHQSIGTKFTNVKFLAQVSGANTKDK